jgi:HlyD family secretion protein
VRTHQGRSFVFLATALLLIAAIFLFPALRGTAVPYHEIAARPLVQHVVATGRVITPSRARIGSEISGVVVERRVQEGDRVAPQDTLIVLRSDEQRARLQEAEAALRRLIESERPQALVALREAEIRLAQAEREVQRRRELVQRGLIAPEAFELAEQTAAVERTAVERARLNAEALRENGPEEALLRARLEEARTALSRTTIRAGVAGTILNRAAEPGDLVQPGQVLFEIALDGETEISVRADERNLAYLAPGQRAECITDAFPDTTFPATLYYVSPLIDADRGTVELRLRVPEPPAWLRQDMTVTVSIETARRETALTVPDEALMEVGNGRATVLIAEGRRARMREVELGLRASGVSEVLSGLAAGDRVLLAAVAEGSRIRPYPAPTGSGRAAGGIPTVR